MSKYKVVTDITEIATLNTQLAKQLKKYLDWLNASIDESREFIRKYPAELLVIISKQKTLAY
jgi:hypothetical protein